MTFALHIGVRAEHVDRVKSLFPTTTVVDGDGWNCWGEKPGTDVNDADTLHIVLGPWGGEVLAEAVLDYVIDSDDQDRNNDTDPILVPMGGYEQQRGIRAVVTSWDDWSTDLRYQI